MALTTFNNTFRTLNPNGITALSFFVYWPTVWTFSNAQFITSLTTVYAYQSSTSFDVLKNFPALTNFDVSVPEMTTVDTTWFAKINTLKYLNINYNYYYTISRVDPAFSDWFSDNPNNLFYFIYNTIQCDSSVQWMAKYALCKPYQLVINNTVCATTQEPFYLYLLSFIDSCQ